MSDDEVRKFSRDNMPEDPLDVTWAEFRKKVNTRAARIRGPFVVETSEGELRCKDGWLCIDARGYPYPVAADEFQLIYAPARDHDTEDGHVGRARADAAAVLAFVRGLSGAPLTGDHIGEITKAWLGAQREH
jgi:hypothetical protein